MASFAGNKRLAVFAEVVRELRKGETQKNEHYERDPIEMWREQEYEG